MKEERNDGRKVGRKDGMKEMLHSRVKVLFMKHIF
jgi:hypothetical protein